MPEGDYIIHTISPALYNTVYQPQKSLIFLDHIHRSHPQINKPIKFEAKMKICTLFAILTLFVSSEANFGFGGNDQADGNLHLNHRKFFAEKKIQLIFLGLISSNICELLIFSNNKFLQ